MVVRRLKLEPACASAAGAVAAIAKTTDAITLIVRLTFDSLLLPIASHCFESLEILPPGCSFFQHSYAWRERDNGHEQGVRPL
jgi:hypothetical protein